MATRVRSFSKINLGLAVGPLRADGFHGLTTLYQTLALHDVVTVHAQPAVATRIEVLANHAAVPCTASGDAAHNTAYRMIASLLKRLGVSAEVRIEIDKRLPVQGGLGAGSANAVAALLGLERELGRAGVEPLPAPERLQLAAEIGSDVPLFLLGGTILGRGRGEQVFPWPDLPATPCVVAVPKMGVSTGAAFRELDARAEQHAGAAASPVQLTPTVENDILEKLSRALASVWTTAGHGPGASGIASQPGDLAENPLLALVRTGIENDFEEVVFSQHPSLRSTKRDLVGSGEGQALYAALSGSGSALFGLYTSLGDARAAQQRVRDNGTEALLTETLPRTAYQAQLFVQNS